MAKFNAEMLSKCVAWVEKNGLYPQPGGAPIKQFCEAMTIDPKTYREWMKNPSFSSAIKIAQAHFKETTTIEVVNALKKKALGFTQQTYREEKAPEKVVIYENGKKVKEIMGEMRVVKAVGEIQYYPPETAAAIFLLTNLDPDNWKNFRGPEIKASNIEPPRELTQKELKEFRGKLEKKY